MAYEIHDFNWYAGQGLDGGVGGKFLTYSECSFSWDTTYNSSTGNYAFVTEGSLDTLYLGVNPSGDTSASPASGYLTAFDTAEPLLVISNFDVVVDSVAASLTGIVGADGNTQFSTPSWVANGGLYDQVTLNSAVLYGLAFDLPGSAGGTALEVILDTYLTSLGVTGGLSAGETAIDAALANSVVRIDYYETASAYVSNGVVTETLAQQYLDTSDCDLLLAA